MNIYFLMKFTLILKTKEKVMKIDLVKQLINEFENSEVFKMKVEMEDAVSYTHLIRSFCN